MKIPAKYFASIFATGLALFSFQAFANTVYKTVDEKGRVTYSDNPTGNKIDEVELPSINTTPTVSPQPYTPPAPKSAAQFSVVITSPSHGTEVTPGQRDLSVNAQFSPSLTNGFKAQLLINNQPYGSPQENGSFIISDIPRGEQNLSVAVLNPTGSIISRSAGVTVYVIRASAPRPQPR